MKSCNCLEGQKRSLSKRLSRHGLWLYLENAAVQGLQFPGNRTAFVSNRSMRITTTGVSNTEETRAKPLTDAGSRQCCYCQIKSLCIKFNPSELLQGRTQRFLFIRSQIGPVVHLYPTESFCLPDLHVICQKSFSNNTVKYSQ